MPGPAFLRGERVSLHPVEADDLEFLQEYRNRKEIRQPLTDSHPRNAHQMEEQFEDESGGGDGIRLLICIENDADPAAETAAAGDGAAGSGGDDAAERGRDGASPESEDDEAASDEATDDGLTRIGEIGVPWVRQPHASGMLMYWVATEHQGNGYVTDATRLVLDHVFEDMRLNRVWAMVIGPNEASRHVLEKVGFTHEGVERQGTFVDGEWTDNHRYGILAEEWLDGA